MQKPQLLKTKKKKKKRRCLRCDQHFKSEGPWQRLCPECRKYANSQIFEEYSLGY